MRIASSSLQLELESAVGSDRDRAKERQFNILDYSFRIDSLEQNDKMSLVFLLGEKGRTAHCNRG